MRASREYQIWKGLMVKIAAAKMLTRGPAKRRANKAVQKMDAMPKLLGYQLSMNRRYINVPENTEQSWKM